MILITKRNHNSFWRNFPARAKQMPSEVFFVGKKSMDVAIQSSHNKIVIIGNSNWVKNHFCA